MNLIKKLDTIYTKNILLNKAYIEKKQWRALAKEFDLKKKEFLFEAIIYAQQFAQCPLSHFKVGAVGLGKNEELYFGANIEFPSFPLNQSIHAEQCLISLAHANNETELKEIYVTAFPCGHCRQFMRELNTHSSLKIYVQEEKSKAFSLKNLLPYSFGPENLGITQSLFEKKNRNKYHFINKKQTLSKKEEENLLLGLKNAFSPYSNTPSSCVLYFKNHLPIIGSSIESCAYNPSLSAFHMAYSQLIMNKINPKKITQIHFSEKENILFSNYETVRSFCSYNFKNAKLTYILGT
jgi:cytidine deaminase